MTREQLIERAKYLEQTAKAMRAYAADPNTEIQYSVPFISRDYPICRSKWYDCEPAWDLDCWYRIKPN